MRHGLAVVFLGNSLVKFELKTDLEVDYLHREVKATGTSDDLVMG